MKNYLLQILSFQNFLGVNESFDFITGRDFFYQNKSFYKNVTDKNSGIHQDKTDDYNDFRSENFLKKQNKAIFETNKFKTEIKSEINESKESEASKVDSKKKTKIDLSNIKTFNDLVTSIQNFNGCELKLYSNNTVVFDGNEKAKIMLIGEAPGETEDREGKPFCGQSGMLLRKALNCINLNTSNLLITNTVYWRPPENRKPTEQELEICKPFMLKMIEIIKPKLIILCGATAIEGVLGIRQKMSQITGKLCTVNINLKQMKVFQIYHPSFLLRQPGMKKIFWEHLLKLDNELKKL